MPDLKTGALTRDEIQSVWEGAVDKGYRDPLVAAGEGQGFEAWTQLFSVLERASIAIDVTTQAMFIAPWSGQSNPPASGGQPATVALTIQRTRNLEKPLLLGAGVWVALEQTTDFSPTGSEVVQTGRRYQLAEDLFFPPGVQGPFTVNAVSDRVGYGYNNPRIGTISAIEQIGSGFNNLRATIATVTNPTADLTLTATKTTLTTFNEPDMFVPAHQGQYVQITSGLDNGKVARMVAFQSPNPPLQGSGMQLELMQCVGLSAHSGTPMVGEAVLFSHSGNNLYGRVVDFRLSQGVYRLAFVVINGNFATFAVGATYACAVTGATGTVSSLDFTTSFTDDAPVGGVGGPSWLVLDWANDWGLTVSNAAQPSGGLSAMLDELGSERAIGRSPGESDDNYRVRIREIAEVVTPNAIKRIVNRAIPGLQWCLREAGQVGLPGFFYDGDQEGVSATPHGALNDAYDFDTVSIVGTVSGTFNFQEPVVLETTPDHIPLMMGWMGRIDSGTTMVFIRRWGKTPTTLTGLRVRGLESGATLLTLTSADDSSELDPHRYHIYLDYSEFRGFFIVSVPALAYGEFGFAYDDSDLGAYDVSGTFDGYPRLASDTYLRVWNAVDAAHAGGVLWKLELNDGSTCP
jgi:hypothetical protein